MFKSVARVGDVFLVIALTVPATATIYFLGVTLEAPGAGLVAAAGFAVLAVWVWRRRRRKQWLPDIDGENLYAILGVPQSADPLTIRRALSRLSHRYHPDRAAPEDRPIQLARFIRLNKAYELLSNPETRHQYDWMIIENDGRIPPFDEACEQLVGELKHPMFELYGEWERGRTVTNWDDFERRFEESSGEPVAATHVPVTIEFSVANLLRKALILFVCWFIVLGFCALLRIEMIWLAVGVLLLTPVGWIALAWLDMFLTRHFDRHWNLPPRVRILPAQPPNGSGDERPARKHDIDDHDPYRILGLPHNADQESIKRAYRELSRVYHPDSVGPDDLPQEQARADFSKLTKAYEILSDPEMRRTFHEMRDSDSDHAAPLDEIYRKIKDRLLDLNSAGSIAISPSLLQPESMADSSNGEEARRDPEPFRCPACGHPFESRPASETPRLCQQCGEELPRPRSE